MKLNVLMITQAVDLDDPVLGFVHDWINTISLNVQSLHILCLRAGKYNLKNNVKLHILRHGKIKKYVDFLRKLKILVREKSIDLVFAHMCPIYIIASFFVTGRKIPLTLWYAHSRKTSLLRVAHYLSAAVYSCSIESFPLRSNKLNIFGHGINITKFTPSDFIPQKSPSIRILSLGRISTSKHYETMFPAIKNLVSIYKNTNFIYEIVGPAISKKDRRYLSYLKNLIRRNGLENVVKIGNPIKYSEVEKAYHSCDIYANMTVRHSLDKAVLEAMACGCLILTTNKSFRPVLGEYANLMIAEENNSDQITQKLLKLISLNQKQKEKITAELRNKVVENHNLKDLAIKLTNHFKTLIEGYNDN